jgi:hypothetical protein
VPIIPSSPTPSRPVATTAGPNPGGISLSRAAAERMPLKINLDASYFDGKRIVLSGKATRQSLDAALFLTALRAACEDEEPYFSLDPDDGVLWQSQGEQASEELWKHVESDLTQDTVPGPKESIGTTLYIRTLSARKNYSAEWNELAPKFPALRSKLVFKPDWLRQTRFGKVLYEADVLLKELSSGVAVLSPGELRAAQIKGYLAADAERAAKLLLADKSQVTRGWRGSRLWFDIAQSPPAPFVISELKSATSSAPDPQMLAALTRRGLIRASDLAPEKTVIAKKDGNVVDLSFASPRMFVDDTTMRQDKIFRIMILIWTASQMM